MFTAFIILSCALGLYLVHRLFCYFESRGWMYYIKTKPEGGGAVSSFVAFQEMIEPSTKHVFHVQEQKRHHSEEEEPGADAMIDPDSADASDRNEAR